MKVAVIGGGPAGLYLALLLRKANPAHRVTVVERNAPGATFGWGVVFSDATLENFRAADAESYERIVRGFAHWDDIDVHVKGATITSGGHGFSGIARKALLEVLADRAAASGVELRFGVEVEDDAGLGALGLGDADLVVGADGVNSRVRRRHAEAFRPELDVRPAKFVWLGTTKPFDAFNFIFVETPAGARQNVAGPAHAPPTRPSPRRGGRGVTSNGGSASSVSRSSRSPPSCRRLPSP